MVEVGDAAVAERPEWVGDGAVVQRPEWVGAGPSTLPESDACFPGSFFEADAVRVARSLLGACLLSSMEGETCAGIIIETEAYGGAEDPASHAATRTGVTERNRAMFGPAGCAYIYRSYGIHWCMNVVTGAEGDGQAVLIRGLRPVHGLDVMTRRRSGRHPLASGPGRLTQALGITDELYGHDLSNGPLRLLSGWRVGRHLASVSGRIGITAAAEWPWRFYVRGEVGR